MVISDLRRRGVIVVVNKHVQAALTPVSTQIMAGITSLI